MSAYTYIFCFFCSASPLVLRRRSPQTILRAVDDRRDLFKLNVVKRSAASANHLKVTAGLARPRGTSRPEPDGKVDNQWVGLLVAAKELEEGNERLWEEDDEEVGHYDRDRDLRAVPQDAVRVEGRCAGRVGAGALFRESGAMRAQTLLVGEEALDPQQPHEYQREQYVLVALEKAGGVHDRP